MPSHRDQARLEPWDRNPLSVVQAFTSTGVNGGGGGTTRWTYTVPTSRKCYIDVTSLTFYVWVAFAANTLTESLIRVTSGGVSATVMRGTIIGAMAVGFGSNQSAPGPGYLQAGEAISAFDYSNGLGSYHLNATMKGTECDA